MSTQEKYGLYKHLVRFSTEKECYDYLFSVKWGTRPKCSSCGNTHMNYFISTRRTYKCSQCYKQFSLIQGTIFEKSRIPLTKWFMAIYFFTTNKRGVSSVQLSKWIGVTQRTAWFMLHRLREALKEENDIVLSGIVEVDETFIGPDITRDTRLQKLRKSHYDTQEKIHGFSRKKRYKLGIKQKRGRKKGTTKEVIEKMKIERGGKPYISHEPTQKAPFEKVTIVLGMMERNGRVILKRLGLDRRCISQERVYPFLQQHIKHGSTIITDQHIIYQDLPNLPYNYKHLSVNHDVGYVIDGIHINGVENAWKHLKKLIDGTYFHVSKHHFERYLDEYSYRWNRREEGEKELFESFLPFVVNKRLPFKMLRQKEMKIAA